MMACTREYRLKQGSTEQVARNKDEHIFSVHVLGMEGIISEHERDALTFYSTKICLNRLEMGYMKCH